ncbi:hypothetical protein ACFLU2_01050 [Chloroflexota bacterium]
MTAKLLGILCLGFLVGALLIAWANPARGYELSIYASTPILVWVLIALAFMGGVIIVVHQVATKSYKICSHWMIGILVVLVARVVTIYLPYIRGYVTWGGDHIEHWGMIKDILQTGHVASDNFYPFLHTLISQVTIITSVPESIIINLSTAFFSILFVLSIYLLSGAILQGRATQLLATTASAVVLFNDWEIFLRPQAWAYLLTPLVLFLFFKRTLAHNSLLVIFLILFSLVHIFGAFVVVIAFIIIGLSKMTITLISNTRNNTPFTAKLFEGFPVNATLILSVILISWILAFPTFNTNIRSFYMALIGITTADIFANISISLDKLNLDAAETVRLWFLSRGEDVMFILLSLIAWIIIIRRIVSNRIRNLEDTTKFISILAIIVAIGLLYATYLFGVLPSLGSLGGERFLRYTLLLTPIAAGFVLSQWLKTRYHIRFVSLGIATILIIASILSISGLYRSPLVMRPGVQVTQMQLSGMEWSIEKKDRTIDYARVLMPPIRFARAILGFTEARSRTDIKKRETLQLPDHLNYDSYDTLGESLTADKYVVVDKYDRMVYDTVWEDVDRFDQVDFDRLGDDSTANRLYTNGETNVWYISTQREE